MFRKTCAFLLVLSIIGFVFGTDDLPIFHDWVPDSLVPRPPVHHWTLDNGLEVLFWENHTVPVVAARIAVKTGSINEGKYLGCGISHYLEHLVSGGTTSKHTEDEYKKMIQEYSLATNAYTTSNITCYYGSGPAKSFPVLLSMLAEWVQDCAFDTFEVARETKVILQEMNMGREEPDRVMWKLFNNLFYKVSPYRYPTIGYRENFLRITRDELIDYYHNRYAPNNAILSIAGDIDTATVKHLADSLWSDWQRQPIEDIQIPLEPLPASARVAEREMDIETARMRMGFPTGFYGDDDMPALRILGFILSGVATSRLDIRLVNCPNPIANKISAYSAEKYQGRGQFLISAEFNYRNRDTLLKAIWDEIDKIKSDGVRKDEVEWAKGYLAKNMLREQETVDGQAGSMMYSFLVNGRPFGGDFFLTRVNKVTVDDVKRVAQKYLIRERMILAILKPIGATCPSDTILISEKASSRPQFELRTLDNGLRVVLAENPALPTVDLYIYIMGGSLFEPADKAGLAYFTVRYLKEGTKHYPSFQQLQRRMDELAISLSTDIGKHTMYLSSNFIASDLEEALRLASDILLNPIFPERSENKLKDKQIADIKRQHDSWASDAFLFFNEKFYGNHPYGRSVYGEQETVQQLTADDAKNYWFSHLNPKNIVISASGPIPIDIMYNKISWYFGNIKPVENSLLEVSHPQPHISAEEFVKEVDREQVTLIIGYDGCSSKNEADKWALRTAAALLSGTGGLSGWLSIELRGKRNLVYVVWAGASSRLYGGHFSITTQCEPQDLDTVKSIILSQVDRLRKGDFTDDDVHRITEALAERFIMSRQTQANLVSSAAIDELYGFGFNYSEKYPQKISAVKKDDVIRVARKYLNVPITIVMKPVSAKNK